MHPYLHTLAAVALAGLGVYAGCRFARVKNRLWILGFFVPLAAVLLIASLRNDFPLVFIAPFRWIVAGRARFLTLALAVPMLFVTLIQRCERSTTRVLGASAMGLALVVFVVPPLVGPILYRAEFASLGTKLSADGVCLQQTGFTCGPAAAVTALGRLGIKADEGELAILAYTSPLGGTQPDDLAGAMERRFAPDGVRCEFRRFRSLDDLGSACPAMVVVKYAAIVDHWVTVFKVTTTEVVYGDPLSGLQSLAREGFEQRWRRYGIVVRRETREASMRKAN